MQISCDFCVYAWICFPSFMFFVHHWGALRLWRAFLALGEAHKKLVIPKSRVSRRKAGVQSLCVFFRIRDGDRSNPCPAAKWLWTWLSWARARPIADAVTLLQEFEESHQVITSFKQAMTRMNKNYTWITHGTYPLRSRKFQFFTSFDGSFQHFRHVTPLQCFPWSRLRVQLTSPLHESSLRFWTKKLGSPKSLKAAYYMHWNHFEGEPREPPPKTWLKQCRNVDWFHLIVCLVLLEVKVKLTLPRL